MTRPPVWTEPPDGYEWVAAEDHDWSINVSLRRCRVRGCGRPAVAQLRRSHRTAKLGWTWWAYCPDHLFGRWIERGKVMHWILREVAS